MVARAFQIAHAMAKTLDLFVLSASHPHRNGYAAIEKRKIETADPSKLTICADDTRLSLDRLGKNTRQLPATGS